MKKVYLLQHSYECGPDNEYDETKLLGIFSSRLEAEKAIDFYKVLPGFRDFSEDCFHIGTHELNRLEWREGFVQVFI